MPAWHTQSSHRGMNNMQRPIPIPITATSAPLARFGVATALNFLLYGNCLSISGTQFAYTENDGLCVVLHNPIPTQDGDAISLVPTSITLKDFVDRIGPFVTPPMIEEMEKILWKNANRKKV